MISTTIETLPTDLLGLIIERAGARSGLALARCSKKLLKTVHQLATERGLIPRLLRVAPLVQAHYPQEYTCSAGVKTGLEAYGMAQKAANVALAQLRWVSAVKSRFCRRLDNPINKLWQAASSDLQGLQQRLCSPCDKRLSQRCDAKLADWKLDLLSAVFSSSKVMRSHLTGNCVNSTPDPQLLKLVCQFRYADNDFAQLVDLILSHGAKPDSAALAWVARRGNWDVARRLLQAGADPRECVEMKGDRCTSAFVLAVDLGQPLRELRQIGLMPAELQADALKPVELHALWSRWDLFDDATFRGLNLNPNRCYELNDRTHWPLETALRSLGADADVEELGKTIECLEQMQLDIACPNSTPLVHLLIPGLQRAPERLQLIQQYLERIDLKRLSPEGWSLLQLAAHECHWPLFLALLEKGAREAVDAEMSVLHAACNSGVKEETCLLFLKKLQKHKLLQKLINSKCERSYSPLDLAAAQGRVEVCRYLLDQGASLGVSHLLKLVGQRFAACSPLQAMDLDRRLAEILLLSSSLNETGLDAIMGSFREHGYFGPRSLEALCTLTDVKCGDILRGSLSKEGFSAIVQRKDIELLAMLTPYHREKLSLLAPEMLCEALTLDPTADNESHDRCCKFAGTILELSGDNLTEAIAMKALRRYLESELDDMELFTALVRRAQPNAATLQLAFEHDAPYEQLDALLKGHETEALELATQHCANDETVLYIKDKFSK